MARRLYGAFVGPRHDLVIVSRTLSGAIPLADAPEDLAFTEVRSRSQVEAMGRLAPKDAARYERLFSAGSSALLARKKGEIVGWGWGSTELDADLHPMGLSLRSGDFYIHDLYVVPTRRGQDIARWIHLRRFALAQERGSTTALGTCLRSNRPAQKALAKVGFRVIGEMRHRRFLIWRRSRLRLGSVPPDESAPGR